MKTLTSFFFAISFSVIISAFSQRANAQLIIDTLQTPQQLVSDVLLGQGISAYNIQCNCPQGAFGFFDGTNSNIGIPAGVLLTTGKVLTAVGPNNSSFAGVRHNIMFVDSQLTSIVTGATNDPCILEFDFIPDSSQLQFKYVFASEEYNEYVGSTFNDAFGFFLTGPGITNPNNNIALIPSTSVPITINNVNNGNHATCPSTGFCTYCQYYFDNCNGTSIQYDGFTTVLTAEAIVTQGQSYHIKMAIADVGDWNFDSGVFLECGSFSSREEGAPSPCANAVRIPETQKNELSIYPNPVKNILNIRTTDKLSGYEIVSIMGQVVLKQDANANSFSIDVSNLAAGTYIFKTTGPAGSSRQLFIKE